jgi:hypothetical protein
MTAAGFYLRSTETICFGATSHRDFVASPLCTPCCRSLEAIAAPPKRGIGAGFVAHRPRLPRVPHIHSATLRHRGSLNPHSPGAVRAV